MSLPSPSMPLACLLTALLLGGCGADDEPLRAEPGEHLSGGATTVLQSDRNAFSLPSANLAPSRRLDFSVGNSFFRNPWVIAPSSTTARDGLGPLFNTNACQNCHVKDGRGHPPGADAVSAVSMLVRLSIPAGPADGKTLLHQGVIPEPTYGGQLQDVGIPGVAPEGKVRVDYEPLKVRFEDGTEVELRKPILRISQLGYGPMHPQTMFSARVAPPMIGLGLLEAIPEEAILANADPDDRNGDGIRGRANQVWDAARQRTALGRFGWKAGQPDIPQQNAHAFANDMGLTSSLLPHDDCSAAQVECAGARRRRAGSQRQHLRPGAVLQPQPGGPGAAQGGRPAGAGRQASVRPGQLRGLPRSRLHYRFRRQRAGAGQPADSSLFRPVAA